MVSVETHQPEEINKAEALAIPSWVAGEEFLHTHLILYVGK